MGGIAFIKKNLFKTAVLISLCVILFYVVDPKLDPSQKSAETEEEICHTTEDLPNAKLKPSLTTVQLNETSNPVTKTKTSVGVNTVKLAEIIGDEQKVIVESNTWQFSPDIILVQKGIRTNWIFKLINDEECNGKISIEKFGMIIPIIGKEMSMIFAPWKDFTITCDQGKFNYYVKVVDRLGAANTSFINENKSSQKSVSQNRSAKTTTYTKKTTNPVSTVKPKEDIKQKDNGVAVTPSKETATSKENDVENKQAPTKEEPAKQPEIKKGGILEHLFHHHY